MFLVFLTCINNVSNKKFQLEMLKAFLRIIVKCINVSLSVEFNFPQTKSCPQWSCTNVYKLLGFPLFEMS